MKKVFNKIFLLFAFILNLCFSQSFAQSLGISSVSFDNSGAFMSINSPDNLEYPLEKPELMSVEEDNEVYFELKPAILNNGNKSYLINTNEIEEINITQASKTPDIVRVSLKYKSGFNPQNISLLRLNNTLFIRFKKPVMTNYYFQEIFKESGINSVIEKINIQQKINSQKSVVNEINSAFSDLTQANQNDSFTLSTKDSHLKTKYYINSITILGDTPILNGYGSYTLIKPVYLANPSRVAFDIKNASVNPMLRNKDITLDKDIIKIGQFDNNTARVVLTTSTPKVYKPVVFGNSQKIALLNTASTSPLNLYTTTADMTSVTSEKADSANNFSAKFAFSKPIIFGFERNSDNIELTLYNVKNYFSGAIQSELRGTAFERIEIKDAKKGGVSLVVPAKKDDKVDIFLGADGKTLRIKLKTAQKFVPTVETFEPIILEEKPMPKRDSNKKYVVIDAGHGGTDYGALRGNINEKDITLDISKRVQNMLEKKGYTVAMTRTDDTYVSLQDRVEFSETFNPDIFVSIHVNSSNSESPSGLETHYYKENSLKLAKHIHAAMLNNINSKDRGLFKSKFYVINHTTAPAILVETGFISNPSERAQLITESRKKATAKAIVEGIDEYFKK